MIMIVLCVNLPCAHSKCKNTHTCRPQDSTKEERELQTSYTIIEGSTEEEREPIARELQTSYTIIEGSTEEERKPIARELQTSYEG